MNVSLTTIDTKIIKMGRNYKIVRKFSPLGGNRMLKKHAVHYTYETNKTQRYRSRLDQARRSGWRFPAAAGWLDFEFPLHID
jgi:hypothetical protein